MNKRTKTAPTFFSLGGNSNVDVKCCPLGGGVPALREGLFRPEDLHFGRYWKLRKQMVQEKFQIVVALEY